MKKVLGFLTGRMFIFFVLIGIQAVFFILLIAAFQTISIWIQAVLVVLALILILRIVNKDQNPAYKIPWIILIALLPVLGMCMYFFFSQRKMSRKERQKAIRVVKETGHLMVTDVATRNALWKESRSATRQSDYIDSAMYPLYKNTETKYYETGEPFFADLLVELEKAQRYIYMEYYIIEEGKMWNSVLEVLERKAAQGLDVRVMYDDLGCMQKLPANYDMALRQKGVRCCRFNPFRPVLNSMFNNRDHRKITVIDGIVGFCGGVNLADEYINEVERFGNWKDASIKLRGGAVRSLLMIFLHLWGYTTDEAIDFSEYAPDEAACAGIEADGFVQPFADSPMDDIALGEGVFINMIARAKEYVYINTPYLVVGSELMTVLKAAASSGVDVRIMVPHIPDKKTVFLLTQSHYGPLIRAGAKIYEYLPGFIHSKTLVSDDRIGMVGTINMDFRSMYLNFECGVWMHGTEAVGQMKQDYMDTVAASKEITYADTRNMPWYKRILLWIFRIFGPLM